MNIDLTRLNSGIVEFVDINLNIPKEKFALECTELLDLKDVMVIGKIYLNSLNDYQIDINIKGIMILACSMTLEPVEYPFDIKIDDDLNKILEEIGQIEENNQNSLDILPIVWENILMEIPMKVVSGNCKDVTNEGDGWRLITEEKKEYVNPEFEKLKDLL